MWKNAATRNERFKNKYSEGLELLVLNLKKISMMHEYNHFADFAKLHIDPEMRLSE